MYLHFVLCFKAYMPYTRTSSLLSICSLSLMSTQCFEIFNKFLSLRLSWLQYLSIQHSMVRDKLDKSLVLSLTTNSRSLLNHMKSCPPYVHPRLSPGPTENLHEDFCSSLLLSLPWSILLTDTLP